MTADSSGASRAWPERSPDRRLDLAAIPPTFPATVTVGLPPGSRQLMKGGDQMLIERVYEEGLVKEWHGNQI